MGMFDTILFTCPKCGKKSETQIKFGPCVLHEYNLDLPISLADAFEINGLKVECNHCPAICTIGSDDLPGYHIRIQLKEE